MHRKLSRLTTRPDAIVVYSGHNEFLARFSLSNRVSYYFDELPFHRRVTWLERAGRHSPLYTLVRQNLENYRVGMVPTRPLSSSETLVGRPVCTPEEANAVVVDFESRLETIVTDCEQIGCLPILIIPPGNDASNPNQSHATPGTAAAARRNYIAGCSRSERSRNKTRTERLRPIRRSLHGSRPTLKSITGWRGCWN